MAYPFSRQYIWLAKEMIRIVNNKIIQLRISDPERNSLEITKGVIYRFIEHKNNIEKKIISMQNDAYLTGDAIGGLADDALSVVWKKLALGYRGDGVELLRPLRDIEKALSEIMERFVKK
ncbi:MAG: hypothetical protein UT05_C0012G0001 [Parcubacteria group bacterium GW2011_GWF2_38_76]|nr:MAG: hypothetical protein UT05_C0012G0001 [Parcubacteria group bacterium GW2011_GWF2_38_76]HBM46051.1 hypothetical protein [Patescibacteria group bacterium]